MSEKQITPSEELTKSIDALLDEVFSDEVKSVEKSIDIAGDAKTTADAALSKVPGSQKDEARGAGRPKQISDVPQTDMDGKRDSQYDAAIAQAHGAEENEEAKKQAKAIDQCSSEGHSAGGSKAPKMAPFKKSDGSDLTEADFRAFEAFQKAQADQAEKAKEEELKKAELKNKQDQEALIKSAVDAAVGAATAKLAKENEELRKSASETNSLIKAMASQPQRAKSITGIEALEKGQSPEEKGPESFSKSEVLDAAFELAKSGKIADTIVSEIEMTGRVADPKARAAIEKFLEGKN